MGLRGVVLQIDRRQPALLGSEQPLAVFTVVLGRLAKH
jgi:hypothetical protein